MDQKLEEKLNNIENLIKKPSVAEEKVVTRHPLFRRRLDPLTGEFLVERSPLTGIIREIVMSWPAGCEDNVTGENLVGMSFGHSSIHVTPTKELLYLNNITVPFRNLHEPIVKGEDIWLRVENGDDTNPHEVSTICTIIGVE